MTSIFAVMGSRLVFLGLIASYFFLSALLLRLLNILDRTDNIVSLLAAGLPVVCLLVGDPQHP